MATSKPISTWVLFFEYFSPILNGAQELVFAKGFDYTNQFGRSLIPNIGRKALITIASPKRY